MEVGHRWDAEVAAVPVGDPEPVARKEGVELLDARCHGSGGVGGVTAAVDVVDQVGEIVPVEHWDAVEPKGA